MKPSEFWNRVLLVLFVLLLCGRAGAQNFGDTNSAWQNCNAPTIVPNSSIINVDVGRDSQVGDVMGQWVDIIEIRWPCIYRSNWNPVASGVTKIQVLPAGAIFPVWGTIPNEIGGANYTVYRLNQNGQEIGFVARLLFPISLFPKIYNINYSEEYSNTAEEFDIGSIPPRMDGQPVEHKARIQIRMVKITNNFPNANSIFSISNFAQFVLKTMHTDYVWGIFNNITGSYQWKETNRFWDQHAGATLSPIKVSIFSTNGTCTTPSAYVDLGQKSINALPDVGTPAGAGMADFYITFHDCPPNMAGITYNFTPVPAWASVSNGVLPLISPSTAAGVGVQVFIKGSTFGGGWKYTTIDINKKYHIPRTDNPFGNYDSSNFRLSARMVRLDPGILPAAGTVHAAMKVIAVYK